MFNNLKSDVINIETTLFGKKLVLKNLYQYNGVVTLQYIPYGGIQMVIDNQIIINTNIGFLATKEIEYDNKNYFVKEFVNIYPNLINIVLPN